MNPLSHTHFVRLALGDEYCGHFTHVNELRFSRESESLQIQAVRALLGSEPAGHTLQTLLYRACPLGHTHAVPFHDWLLGQLGKQVLPDAKYPFLHSHLAVAGLNTNGSTQLGTHALLFKLKPTLQTQDSLSPDGVLLAKQLMHAHELVLNI